MRAIWQEEHLGELTELGLDTGEGTGFSSEIENLLPQRE